MKLLPGLREISVSGITDILSSLSALRVVELTGDTTPDIRAIEQADIIVTTPEKWDGISRSWQNRYDHESSPIGIICLNQITSLLESE